MKKFLSAVILLFMVSISAQISIKTEYIGNSKFYDAVSNSNIGDGSAIIYSANALIPLSLQAPKEDDPYQRSTVWGLSLNGTFVQMNNHHFPVGKELTGNEPWNDSPPYASFERALVYINGIGSRKLHS